MVWNFFVQELPGAECIAMDKFPKEIGLFFNNLLLTDNNL